MLRVYGEQWRAVDTKDTNLKECATAQTSDGCDGCSRRKCGYGRRVSERPIEGAGNAKTKEPHLAF
jgi:hypothetical protein